MNFYSVTVLLQNIQKSPLTVKKVCLSVYLPYMCFKNHIKLANENGWYFQETIKIKRGREKQAMAKNLGSAAFWGKWWNVTM